MKQYDGIEQKVPSQDDIAAVREFKDILAQLEKQKQEKEKLIGEDDW